MSIMDKVLPPSHRAAVETLGRKLVTAVGRGAALESGLALNLILISTL